MYNTINKYYKNTHLLTNSLCIKFIDAAHAVNIGLRKNPQLVQMYGANLIPTDDMRTWKYFLNMAGVKHFTNSDVKIKLLENNELVSLSKEILQTFTYTRDELRKNGSYLDNLLYTYPNDYSYIKGCIYPMDIDEAINAKDGTILSYDPLYIDSNEYNLIPELQEFVQGFYDRYNISEFALTDDLYFTSFLGVLYSKIPNKIVNIRFSKIFTNEVHSFHLEHFFRSNLDLWDNVSKLNNETKFWLYKNLDYLTKHIGTESTFETVLEKIFNTNNIGVGEYYLENKDLIINPNTNDLKSPVFVDNGVKFTTSKLNDSYIMDNNNNLSTNTIINLELTTVNDYDVKFEAELVDDVIRNQSKVLDNSIINKQKTKILDINTIKLFNSNGVDDLLSIMDNWLYLASNNKYTRKLYYTDPNTKNTNEITPLEGFYILLKYLLKLNNNININLTTLKWSKIINSEITSSDNLINGLFHGEYIRNLADEIYDLLPNDIYNVNNALEFKDYMEIRNTLYNHIWLLDSNVCNPIVSGNLKHIVNRLYINGEVDLRVNGNSLTIDGLLNTLGLNFTIADNYDIYSSIKELFLTFTGINISVYEELDKDTDNYIEILNKLTSYTLQIIKSVDDMNSLYSTFTSDSVYDGTNGLVTVLKATVIDPLERLNAITKGQGNNFIENTKVSNFNAPPIFEIYEGITNIVTLPAVDNGESSVFNYDQPDTVIELLSVFEPVTSLSSSVTYADVEDDSLYNKAYVSEDYSPTVTMETIVSDLFLIDNDANIVDESIVVEII